MEAPWNHILQFQLEALSLPKLFLRMVFEYENEYRGEGEVGDEEEHAIKMIRPEDVVAGGALNLEECGTEEKLNAESGE